MILIRIYVTDEAGNQDYCETYVKLQDNNNTCNGTLVNYGGNLKRANQGNIPKANLQIYDNSDQLVQSVDCMILYKYRNIYWEQSQSLILLN
ncbi:MAG: hypothetical protein IPP01_02900 [Saprospiraceae bacterium]|nr:hypothetical protein [Saprospiraceae bacterium]